PTERNKLLKKASNVTKENFNIYKLMTEAIQANELIKSNLGCGNRPTAMIMISFPRIPKSTNFFDVKEFFDQIDALTSGLQNVILVKSKKQVLTPDL
ncbi:MAG: hypothetical protein MHPSP_001864, partial [Paramarteilia canceri]